MNLRRVRRLGWSVVDQGVSSLGNFAVGVFVARQLGASGLGILAVVLLLYTSALQLCRGVASDPLVVRHSDGASPKAHAEWRSATAAATGLAVVFSIGCALICAAAGVLLALGGQHLLGSGLVMLALGLPGLVLQDAWRFAFFAEGRIAKAVVIDVAWTALLTAALAALWALHLVSIEATVLLFGATATAAAVLGAVQARVVPDVRRTGWWLMRHRDLGPRFLFENVTLGATKQMRSAAVAASSGLRSAGGLRGAEILVGPVVSIMMGVSQIAVPETARALGQGRVPFVRLCRWISHGLAGATAAWGVVLLVLFPLGPGKLVLGSVWSETSPLLLPVVLSSVAGSLQVGWSAGLRALGRADLTWRCQFITTATSVCLAVITALLAGATGVVWGTAAAAMLGAVYWRLTFVHACRGHFATPPRVAAGPGPILVASILRRRGATGVQTHISTVLEDVFEQTEARFVSPFESRSPLLPLLVAVRRVLEPLSGSTAVWIYRHGHARLLGRALRAELARLPADTVVYAQCPVSADIALRVREQQRVVLAVHFNRSQADEWIGKGMLRAGGRVDREIREQEARVLSQVDGLVYVSQFARQAVEEHLPQVARTPSTIIPNPIRPSQRASATPKQGDLVTVGSLEARKNQIAMLHVLAAAARLGREYSLTVVGDGPDRSMLIQEAAWLGLEVRFTGHLSDPREVIAGHRLYVHTALVETGPIVVMEAMAEGVPVAADPTGGIPELVRPGVDGILWCSQRPAEAARLLIGLLDDEERLAAYAQAARERAGDYAPAALGPLLRAFLRQPRAASTSASRGASRSRADIMVGANGQAMPSSGSS